MAGRPRRRACLGLGAALLALPAALGAQDVLEARVWLDRGDEPVFRRGESARLYYRASHDAFVAIFQIDTNGSVRLVFPSSPDEANVVRGGFDYRLLFARSPYWQVVDDPGVGYFFLVASPEPLDLSAFGYSHFDQGWDLSRVGRAVYGDPYVAMDDFVAALIPDWQRVPYALDFVTYNVGGRHDYPRFLCYDCHGFRPYAVWNPYAYDCVSFRVVVYDDPYYYPAMRYRGSRVVYARPPRPQEPRFVFKERAAGESAEPLFVEPERRPSIGGAVPPGGSGVRTIPGALAPDAARRPSGAVAPPSGSGPAGRDVRERPSVAAPGGAARPGRPSVATPGTTGRPALQPREPAVRPPSGGGGPPRTPPPASTARPRPGGASTSGGSSGPPPPPPRRPGGGAVPEP